MTMPFKSENPGVCRELRIPSSFAIDIISVTLSRCLGSITLTRGADIIWITENKCRIIFGLQTDYFWITKKDMDYFLDYKKRCRIIFGLQKKVLDYFRIIF